jgi:hypothetical protein
LEFEDKRRIKEKKTAPLTLSKTDSDIIASAMTMLKKNRTLSFDLYPDQME